MSPRHLLKSRFFRHSLLLQGSGALVAASQLGSSWVVAHQLGATGQGLFISAVKTFGVYFMLLNTGIVPAVVSQIGGSATRNNHEKIAAWQGFLIKAYLLAGLLLVALGWYVLPNATAYFFEGNRQLGWWAYWLSFSPLLECMRVLTQCTFWGIRRMRPVAQLDLWSEGGRFLLVAGAAAQFQTPAAVVIATVVSAAWGSLVAMWVYRREQREDPIGLPPLERALERMRDVRLATGLPLGLKLGFMRSLDALMADLLPPLLVLYVGAKSAHGAGKDPGMLEAELLTYGGWVAYFGLAQRLMQVPAVILTGIARNTLPAMSGIAGLKDPERFRKAFWSVTLLGGGMNLVGILAAAWVFPMVVRWFWPGDYAEPVRLLTWIFALGAVFKGFCGAFDSFYIVANRLRASMWISGIGALGCAYLALHLSLTYPQTGAAWGVTAMNVVSLVNFVYIGWFFATKRHLRLFQDPPESDVPPALAEGP